MPTVVIFSRGNAKALFRALRSVQSQLYPAREAIVLELSANEETREVVASARSLPMTYLPVFGSTRRQARFAGIAAATGDWIAFLDANDEWFPHTLDFFSDRLARTSKAPVCFGRAVRRIAAARFAPSAIGVRPAGQLRKALLQQSLIIDRSAFACRKEILSAASFASEAPASDETFDFLVQLAERHLFAAVQEDLAITDAESSPAVELSARRAVLARFAAVMHEVLGSRQSSEVLAEADFQAGLAWRDRNDIAKSLEHLDRAIAMYPSSWRYWLAREWTRRIGSRKAG